MFRMISQSWHMYPLGVLFGLGFDTATEIGLLGISAAEASKGLPLRSILIFPILFAAGMTLVDTTDNILMLGAYRWAFVKPIRKLYYNMMITCVSVIVAVAVGGIEALGLLAGQLHLEGGFWYAIMRLNANFGALGFLHCRSFLLLLDHFDRRLQMAGLRQYLAYYAANLGETQGGQDEISISSNICWSHFLVLGALALSTVRAAITALGLHWSRGPGKLEQVGSRQCRVRSWQKAISH